jgi:hypothetical protein
MGSCQEQGEPPSGLGPDGGFSEVVDLDAPKLLMSGCPEVVRMQAAPALTSAAADSGFDVIELEQADARVGGQSGPVMALRHADDVGGPALGQARKGGAAC